MYSQCSPTMEIMLPTTEESFDELVDAVVEQYNLKEKEHAAAVISVAIRHLPNDQAMTTIQYLGYSVLKSLANHVANYKGEKLKHEAQVDQCVNMLTTDPNNAQARDQLEQWATSGSIAAKTALSKLEPKKEEGTTTDNVLPIKAI